MLGVLFEGEAILAGESARIEFEDCCGKVDSSNGSDETSSLSLSKTSSWNRFLDLVFFVSINLFLPSFFADKKS